MIVKMKWFGFGSHFWLGTLWGRAQFLTKVNPECDNIAAVLGVTRSS